MKKLLKFKWLVIAVWIAAIAALLWTAPSLSKLVQDQKMAEVPAGYPSSKADKLLDEMKSQSDKNQGSTVALVFHEPHKLTDEEIGEIKDAIEKLKDNKDKLSIENVTSYFDEPDLKSRMVSENGTTVLVSLTVDTENKDEKALSDNLYQALEDTKVTHYYTSGWMINHDLVETTQKGLHKTEWITVIFILLVLFLVFRSLVTPFIPLITVGLTYLVTQSIIGFLVKWFNFPLSNFTQIFLVAVLFGIGTDYCILLMNRYKEELANHESIPDAIAATYKNGGRTVFFSGLAVLIGFASIGLSTFSIYRSAAGVAVGVAVLIIALVTIVPFFMALFGRKLFWPSKKSLQHNQSRLWGGAGRFALKRPLIALLIVAAVVLPFLLTYDGTKTFNSLEEIGDDYPSVKGFDIITDNFEPGISMPTTVVIKNDERMDQKSDLMTIEKLTRELKGVDHVDSVRSATQPLGDPIKNFLVPEQAKSLSEGLSDANNGIQDIRDGLDKAGSQLEDSKPQLDQAVSGLDDLIDGTGKVKDSLNKLQNGLSQIQDGMQQGAEGASKIKSGAEQAELAANQLHDQSAKLQQGYDDIADQLGSLSKSYEKTQKGLRETLQSTLNHLNQYAAKHPGAKADPDFQQAAGTIRFLLDENQDNPKNQQNPLYIYKYKLNPGLSKLTDGLETANTNFGKLVQGQEQLASQLGKLTAGLGQLQSGLEKTAQAQSDAVGKIPQLTNGIGDIQDGQKQLKDGISSMQSEIDDLIDGLNKSVKGLGEISDGLTSAEDYLNGLSQADNPIAGFYIPDEALNSKDFKQSLDNYMSPDRKYTTLSVTFDINPYSTEAIGEIDNINAAIKRATDGTPLENAKIGVGGITSQYADLKQISENDYTRTAILMLIGIFIILIGLLRSLIMPLYIIASLVLTYFTAMGITELIFVDILHYSGVTWTMPFFGFVMLIALGVDYSIFLMDRFNEYRDIGVREAIHESMKNMGPVILSAAVILGGTFAAMMPSGVLSLMQIATVIISGLVLYSLLILPLFIPVMVRTFGKANWWPFGRDK